MSALGIIFPDQLSKNNKVYEILKSSDDLLLYEPIESFYKHNHHKQKLVFLLASLRNLKKPLSAKFNIIHEKIKPKKTTFIGTYLKELFLKKDYEEIFVTKPADYETLSELMFFAQSHGKALHVLEDTKFISESDDFKSWSEGKKSLVQEFYYRWLRKKHSILMEDGKPISGKWNLDKENRAGISKLKETPPKREKNLTDTITFDLMVEVEEVFPRSPGELENFNWAVTHDDAWQNLQDFLDRYLFNYGTFQDAINKEDPFLYHSLLSPYLNNGLLDPMDCIHECEKRFLDPNSDIPLNSAEGFIRQILGWREFIRGIYWENIPEYKDLNFWAHKKKLNSNWYDGTTGIPPLDDAIKETIQYGYTHHINRLMIISNLMNLSRVSPHNIYDWFTEMYVDAHEWVMVPNVYGMGTYADGGIFSTKPYICGSSYMLRMSNYKKGEWCDVVDGLYWRFIEKNVDFFKSNHRLSLMPKALEKIGLERKELIFGKAEEFIKIHTC
jgi:deoxyribodipyrimidine photolyase-related protein